MFIERLAANILLLKKYAHLHASKNTIEHPMPLSQAVFAPKGQAPLSFSLWRGAGGEVKN